MSYVEHGPRIFLAGKPSIGMPMIYGDYVLPKKRSEGRLKLHDSCSDVRAWSPNSLENTRYFRELTERAAPTGKIIPFNVVIDNIIGLTSQAQDELHCVKRQLQKYKSLRLTPEQEEQLLNFDYANGNKHQERKESSKTDTMKPLLANAFIKISKSIPLVHSNSYLSIHIPSMEDYQLDSTNPNSQLRSYSSRVHETDSLLNHNYNLKFRLKSIDKSPLSEDDINESALQIKYVDAASQIEKEICEVGVQCDVVNDEYILNEVKTGISQSSFSCKSVEKDGSIMGRDRSNTELSSSKPGSFGSDLSSSKDSQDSETLSQCHSKAGTEFDLDIRDNTHKGIIIQKDSEIIALKNDLCVRDAEIVELRDLTRDLKNSLKEKEDNLNSLQNNMKILHEKLFRVDHQRSYEVEGLKKKLYTFKRLMEQFKQELNKKCWSYDLQSQEMEKFRLHINNIKITEMEQQSKETEKFNAALEQLKNTMQEKDELQKQNREQSCILADQEDEINRLLLLIKQMSPAHNQQAKTEGMLNNLRGEIQNKDIVISGYEERLLSMKQEFTDFFNNLKHCLNDLEELNGSFMDACNCAKCDFDIGKEANNMLHNINVITSRFQSYKIERQNLLQQIKDLENFVKDYKDQSLLDGNRNMKNISHAQTYFYQSELERVETVKNNSVLVLNVRQNTSSTSEADDENDSLYFKNDNSFKDARSDLNICTLQNTPFKHIAEVEQEIIKQVSYSLMKMQSLMQKLQTYLENERPSLIEQVYNFYETLHNADSVINSSHDITLRKQRLSKIWNQYKEGYKASASKLPNDVHQVQIKIYEFVEKILCRQLEGILYLEKRSLYDKQINRAFEMYLKSCINRMNATFYGAGDQNVCIIEEIKRQQKEVQKKDMEIARLKEEIAQHIQQRSEDNRLNEEELQKQSTIKQELLKAVKDLSKKDCLISKLEEHLRVIEVELSTYNNDCNALRKRNKNLDNIKNRLLKKWRETREEVRIKNKKIINLSQQLRDVNETHGLVTIMEEKIKKMDNQLHSLQSENDDLRNKVLRANEIISERNDKIIDLKSIIDKNRTVLNSKILEYNTMMEEKHSEIDRLNEENELLNEKLKDIENKIVGLNATILSLTEENDKINMIYILQGDLTKLNKNERTLKVELNNLKAQFINGQNTNKNVENKLDECLRENEDLRKVIDYWKHENSQLSRKISDEIAKEKSEKELCTLSNKICERIAMFKRQLNMDCDKSNIQCNEMHRHEEKRRTINKVTAIEAIEYNCTKKETKENEIEKLQKQQLRISSSNDLRDNNFEYNYINFEPFDISENDITKLRYKVKYLENKNKEKQMKVEKLLTEVETRNCEIMSLKESINCLLQDNADHRALLKSEVQKYQDNLTLMKRNYDSSFNALCERHKNSVETLQKRYEDAITGERSIFDSENWLESLDVKELVKLHDRICTYTSCTINNKLDVISLKDDIQYLFTTDTENEKSYTPDNDYENKFQRLQEKDKGNKSIPLVRHKEEIPNTLLLSDTNERDNLFLQQWHFSLPNQDKRISHSLLQDFKFNLQQNFTSNNTQTYGTLKDNTEGIKQTVETDSFKKQRWNFINQCSTYHKLNNTY